MRIALALLLAAAATGSMQAQDTDPRVAALAGFKTALESGNVKTLSGLAAGKDGDTLRKLADAYTRARAASDRLDNALKEKRILLVNPFAASANPLADLQLDILELTKENNQDIARVRFGPRGKTVEETLLLAQESGLWRVSLPAELVKDLRSLDKKEARDRRVQAIDKLAELLDSVAKDVQSGTLKTKESVLLRIAKGFRDAGIGDGLK
jgi:hypothetical protein